MRIFQNLSIKNRLIVIILLVTMLAAGVGFAHVIVNDIKTFKGEMVNNTIMNAKLIGEYCVTPLAFDDKPGAEDVLAKLGTIPAITQAYIYDNQGNIFASFNKFKDKEALPPLPKEISSEFKENNLHVFHPIIYRDKKYGAVYLRASTSFLDDKIKNYLLTMVLLFGGLILLSYFLAFKLQSIISKPILKLAQATEKVSEEADYSLRVQKQDTGEIGILYDGFNSMLEQIQTREKERDNVEKALRESEERFRSLVSNIPGVIYRGACGAERTMEYLSELIEKITGYPASDFISNRVRTFATIIHPEDRTLVQDILIKAVAAKKPYSIEYRIIRSDGKVRWVFERGQAAHKDKIGVLWLDGVLFDITERKQIEEKLKKYRNHLEDLVERRTKELQKAIEELEAFSYSVSHDLRTPLRAMEGFSQALVEDYSDKLDAKGKEFTRRIRNAAQRMENLIHDLLEYSRLSISEIKLYPINLGSVVKRVLRKLEPEIKEKKARVTVEKSMPDVIAHDSILEQVVENLLTNALKFVAPGVKPKVRIWSEQRKERVKLWVEDNGIGISPEYHDKIFKVFERLHGVEKYSGTGIGLAIVRRCMEKLGGNVGLHSSLGKGSRFWIELMKGKRR